MSFEHGSRQEESIESRNQRVINELEAGMLPVLPFELEVIDQLLERVKQDQVDLGRELSEVNHQGSETWHDNFAANNAQRNSVVVATRGNKLTDVQSRAVDIGYPPEGHEVTIGSILELEFPTATQIALLTGTASERSEASHLPISEDAIFITIQSPVGQALIGSKSGEIVVYGVGDRELTVNVLSVSQLRIG